MVGGRSLGCRTCKIRKIKCDERRPVCFQCEKSQRKCTGALSPFVYQAEMLSTCKVDPTLWIKEDSEQPESSQTQKAIPEPSHADSPPPSLSPPPRSMPVSQNEVLSANLVQALHANPSSLSSLGECFPLIPCQIGASEALKAAVECILYEYWRIVNPQQVNEKVQLHLYGRALQVFRETLEQPTSEASPETLCAALVICAYEVLKKSDCPRWITHAGGTAALLLARGPEGFTSEFERWMLYAQMGSTIASCLVKGTPCFIESPEWQAILDAAWFPDPADSLSCKSLAIYSGLPSLLLDIRLRSIAAAQGSSSDPEIGVGTPFIFSDLLSRAWTFRERLLRLQPMVNHALCDASTILQLPSTDANAPFPTSYHFGSLGAAQAYTFYWRMIIIIDRVLERFLGFPGQSRSPESLTAARNICMSVEYAQTWRPLGCVFILCGLPVVAAVYDGRGHHHQADLEPGNNDQMVRQWVLGVMQDLGTPLARSTGDVRKKYYESLGMEDVSQWLMGERSAEFLWC